MTKQARMIIAGLSTVVIGLVIALGLSLSSGHDGDGTHTGASSDNYMGMMQAMGNMKSDEMLQSMKQVLGPDAYAKMLDHMKQHRQNGQAPAGSTMDSTMHRMMDGMMQRMPDDKSQSMPMMQH